MRTAAAIVAEGKVMSEERRESYRCAVQSKVDTAALRTGRGDIMVRIVEESAGGFTISGDKPRHLKKIKAGQTMSMVASSGCYEVKVVHNTDGPDGVRVGLQRIREVQFLGSGATGAQLTAIAALVVAVFIGGLYIPETWKPQPEALAQGRWRLPEAAESAAANLTHRELADHYLRLDSLRSPQYTRELNLTAGQQKAISGIVAETSQELAQLYKQQAIRQNAAKGDVVQADWSNNSLKLMQASWDRIHEVMTPQQRDKLRKIPLSPAASDQAGT